MLSFLANTNAYCYNQPSAQHASITAELLTTQIWNLGIIFNMWNCSSHTPRHAYTIYLNAWPGNVLYQFELYCLKHNCYSPNFKVSKISDELVKRGGSTNESDNLMHQECIQMEDQLQKMIYGDFLSNY
jgi:hypothetical protein